MICETKGTSCEYSAAPSESPIVSVKRKYRESQRESEDLREVLWMLQHRTEAEALDILSWIRSGMNTHSILASARNSESVCRNSSDTTVDELSTNAATDSPGCDTHSSISELGAHGIDLTSNPLCAAVDEGAERRLSLRYILNGRYRTELH